jgi:hypothetical protein
MNEVRDGYDTRIQRLENETATLSNMVSALDKLEKSVAKGFEDENRNTDIHFKSLPAIFAQAVGLLAVSNVIAEIPNKVKDAVNLPAVITARNRIQQQTSFSCWTFHQLYQYWQSFRLLSNPRSIFQR